MRRLVSDQADPQQPPRFCPKCGSANTGRGLRCTICGYAFEPEDSIARYWDVVQQPNRTEPDSLVDEVEASELTEEYIPAADGHAESAATAPYRPVIVDPWSSLGGRLGAEIGSAQALSAPDSSGNVTRREGGPPGWFLGLVGLLLIAIVAGAALMLVVRPFLADRVQSATSDAIVSALANATVVPDLNAGTVVIKEHEINRTIRANRDDYAPLKDLRVQIRRKGISATFSVYGVSGTLTGSVKVVNDRIVIADPSINGIADRMIDVDSIAQNAAEAINDLLARHDLKPTGVRLTDNTLTITTMPRK
jgi:hypothetical protein